MRPVPSLTRKVAVLDFQTPKDYSEEKLTVEGWWFSARDLFRNPRAGSLFADVLSARLADLKYVEQRSRSDIKYYMGRKRALLEKEFKGYTEEQYDEMIREISPVDYGYELGVDYVITGRIIKAFTSHQRTIHSWHSYVEVEVDVWDMATGQIAWTRRFSERDWFSSQKAAMRKLAASVVHALDRSFFRKQGV